MPNSPLNEKLLQAIEHAKNNRWHEAHSIVQNLDNPHSYWIHAVLHRIEGDHSNANYWYSRAGRRFSDISPHLELSLIADTLKTQPTTHLTQPESE